MTTPTPEQQQRIEQARANGFEPCPLCRCFVARDFLEDRIAERSGPEQQQKARETVCGNCSGKLYQVSDPNNIHWYHSESGDVRCPTRFAKPIAAALAEAGGVKAQRTEEELQAVGFQRCPLCRCSVAKDYLEDRMSEYVVEAGGAQGDRFIPAPETEASRNDPEERTCVACGKPSWAHSCNRPPLGATATPQGDLVSREATALMVEQSDFGSGTLHKQVQVKLANIIRNEIPTATPTGEQVDRSLFDSVIRQRDGWLGWATAMLGENTLPPDQQRAQLSARLKAAPTDVINWKKYASDYEIEFSKFIYPDGSKVMNLGDCAIQIGAMIDTLEKKVTTLTGECVWTPDNDGVYWPTCGEPHEFTVGGPIDNMHYFCPYCGRKLVEHAANKVTVTS